MKKKELKNWKMMVVRIDVHAKLQSMKQRKEAFDDVIRRLLNLGEFQEQKSG